MPGRTNRERKRGRSEKYGSNPGSVPYLVLVIYRSSTSRYLRPCRPLPNSFPSTPGKAGKAGTLRMPPPAAFRRGRSMGRDLLYAAAAGVAGGATVLAGLALWGRRWTAPRSAENDGKPRVCVCACGSVAAVKVPLIVEALVDRGVYVDLVLSGRAAFFLGVEYKGEKPGRRLRALQRRRDAGGTPLVQVWRDEDEWGSYRRVGGDRVLHIDIAKRNQVLLVAPCSAGTMAKLALGISDNLLTCVARAFYNNLSFGGEVGRAARHFESRAVFLAFAMNTYMWRQKVTAEHLERLARMGMRPVLPVEKELACGDVGYGAMADVDLIVGIVEKALRAWRAQLEELRDA